MRITSSLESEHWRGLRSDQHLARKFGCHRPSASCPRMEVTIPTNEAQVVCASSPRTYRVRRTQGTASGGPPVSASHGLDGQRLRDTPTTRGQTVAVLERAATMYGRRGSTAWRLSGVGVRGSITFRRVLAAALITASLWVDADFSPLRHRV